MPIPSIDNLLANPAINYDPVLHDLLLKAESIQDCIIYGCDLVNREVIYISPSCLSVLGYHQSDFIKGGPDFIFKITDDQCIPAVIHKQVTYVNRMKSADYDPCEVLLLEFPVKVLTQENGLKEIFCIAVVLTFNIKKEPWHFIGFWSCGKFDTIEHCRSILHAIKERHNEIYTHPTFEVESRPLEVVHVTNKRMDSLITNRETEVLSLISKGFLTKEIAAKLNISFHTAEGYRKSLLKKFEAKNSAELIKKASKVFWLE